MNRKTLAVLLSTSIIFLTPTVVSAKGLPNQDYINAVEYYGQEDYSNTFKFLERAAKDGDKKAQWFLGVLYSEGEGTPQDHKKGFQWVEKSAKQGYSKAQERLGKHYYHGEGVPKDLSKAFYWFKESSKKGNANAQLSIAAMYHLGEGVGRDFVWSYVWSSLASLNGLADANAIRNYAMSQLGEKELGQALVMLDDYNEMYTKKD